ncbi:hypothetical protein OG948_06685 [Embleya sp. NBC_00888]|uniref:hypothetical protein n=1 Tax=Embleya sp. NBC_00888 TaxID=2975960 RepID=UPI003867CC48|nr:hypothetical protein OG948_06685 [Embleya sp. NBC_00888]
MRRFIAFVGIRHPRTLIGLSVLCSVVLGGSAAAPRAEAAVPTVPGGVAEAVSGVASEPGGDITRSEVLERAEDWYDRDVQYDQAAEAPDPEGAHDYRTDCSGMVAMAWHLPSTDFNTDSLDRRSVTVRVAPNDLLPGDALDDTADGHVVIFTGWVSRGTGTFTYIQLANSQTDMAKGTGSFDGPLLAGLPTANYFGLRYNRIVDDSTSSVESPARVLDRYPWQAPWSSARRVDPTSVRRTGSGG